jgi:hypothetical protein
MGHSPIGIVRAPGGARKKLKSCDGTRSGGLPAVTEISLQAEIGLDNWEFPTLGFKDWFESSTKGKTRMKCGSSR